MKNEQERLDMYKVWIGSPGNLTKIPIKLNGPDVSDIIIKSLKEGQTVYRNTATNAESAILDEVVRKGKRFITTVDLNYFYGYYVYYCEEYDCIIIVIAECNLHEEHPKWKETQRFFTSKTACSRLTKETMQNVFSSGKVDICGQTAQTKDSFDATCFNMPSGSVETLSAYFGQFATQGVNNLLCYDKFFKEEHRKYLDGSIPSRYALYENEYRKNEGFEDMVLPNPPKDAFKTMTMAAKAWFDSTISIYSAAKYSMLENGQTFTILQKVEDKAVVRRYSTSIVFQYPLENSKIELHETQRILLEKMGAKDYINKDLLYSEPIWVDDMKGTFLEYSAYIPQCYADSFKKALQAFGNKEYAKNVANKEFYGKYEFTESDSIAMAVMIASMPLFEMILNLKAEESHEDEYHNIWTRIFFELSVVYNNPFLCAENMFGAYDLNGKTIDQMLGLPKGGYKIMVAYNEFSDINALRLTFKSAEGGLDYLAHMNKDNFEYFVKCVFQDLYEYNVIPLLRILFKRYGVKNWRGFLKLLILLNEEENLDLYNNYLTYLERLGDAGKDAQWKLSGEALAKAYATLEVAVYSVSCSDYENIAASFNRKAKKWKELCNIRDKNFAMKYPQKPEDLIVEGISLNHCAKEAINKVSGGETEIFFIRKADSLNTPYYTIEIKEKKVRQCHGKNNRNVEEAENIELIEFIKKFCKKNSFIYDNGEALLGF